MYKQYYRRFLTANAAVQHYSCHSHYYWPDVTREAMLEYWEDSAKYVDEKWTYFFANAVPQVQSYISSILNTGMPEQIVFAPNTHELVARLLSCLDYTAPPAILSTDSEFHSFNRQISRLNETGAISLHQVSTLPFSDFEARFITAILEQKWDMIFISQVFFNSGFVVRHLQEIVDAVADSDTIIVIDGYHGFMALPTDLAPIADRIFYLGGGYKYAQAGEGACFAHVPPGCTLRPVYTGWFAEFGELHEPRSDRVNYANNAMRFAGATMDFCALYRLRAVLRLFDEQSIDVATIDKHVKTLQKHFLHLLDAQHHPLLNRENLMIHDESERGHFLTFNLPDGEVTEMLSQFLRNNNIQTDFRGNRLRFGFGLYHDAQDIDLACLKHD